MRNPFRRRVRRPQPLRAIISVEGSPANAPALVPGRIPLSVKIDAIPEIRHVIEHKPRPAPPRPERITVVYVMQDGQELRTWIPLHGQADWIEAWPRWLDPGAGNWPPVQIRYHLGYADSC